MRDSNRIKLQELANFKRAKEIFNDIFNDNNTTYTQMPDLSVSDMRMQVSNYKFNVELKSRSTSIYKYNEMPIKVKKLINLRKDTKPDERLLYMALVEDGNYYIWDLQHIDWSECRLDNMKAKKQEYNIGGTYYTEEPYFFIPLSMAVKVGNNKK